MNNAGLFWTEAGQEKGLSNLDVCEHDGEREYDRKGNAKDIDWKNSEKNKSKKEISEENERTATIQHEVAAIAPGTTTEKKK